MDDIIMTTAAPSYAPKKDSLQQGQKNKTADPLLIRDPP